MTPTSSLSSMSENASRARESSSSSAPPRKQVACERCKARKARCDRQVPKCERCRVALVPCEYASTRRPPGFPMGHRQLLEDKILHLEAEISRLQRGNNSDQATEGITAHPASTIGSSATVATLEVATSEDNASRSQEEEQTRSRFSGNAEQASDSADDSTEWREKHLNAPTVVRTGRIKEMKPPDDLVLSLTSLYFRHVHHWLPFLDVRHIFADYVQVGEPSLITYALFGATLQYSMDPRLTQSRRDAFWKYCKRTILVEALEEPSYHTLEALTVLALDLSGMTNGPQVWGVLAVAVKLAQQLETSGSGHALRMASAADEAAQAATPDVSSIRRLFWAIYALDCYVAITTRHASDMSNQVIQNLSPFRSALWHDGNTPSSFNTTGFNFEGAQPSPDSNSTVSITIPTTQLVFNYQLELLDISRSLHALYIDFVQFEHSAEMPSDGWFQSVIDWSSTMDTWFAQLPATMRIPVGEMRLESGQQHHSSPLVATLNVYYYALRIYLHGLGDFMTHQQPPQGGTRLATFAEDSRLQCIRSVEQMTRIAALLLPKGPNADRLGWPFAWALWVGARYCLASRYRDRAIAPHYFDQLIQSLGGLSRYWQVGSHYLRLLRIAQNELVALSNPGSQAVPSHLLLSVVDWRVASCEVEDQGRVDPILRASGLAPLEKGIDFYNLEMLLGGSGSEVTQSHAGYHGMMGNESMTNWFSVSSMRSEQEAMHQTMTDSYDDLRHGYG